MNWRLFVIVTAIAVSGVVNGALLYEESITETDSPTVKEQRQNDPFFDMTFTPSQRQGNLEKFGFDKEEIAEVVKKIGVLEQRLHTTDPDRNIVTVRIDAASDADALISAFCGTGSVLPVRYSAMPFLLKVRDNRLKVVDLQVESSLEEQDWGPAARIQAVYETADLNPDRQTDSVKMVMAAVIEGQQQLVIDHKEPFGRGLFTGWSWSSVQKRFPGVRGRVEDYVALMHVVLETATGEQGICATPEESHGL